MSYFDSDNDLSTSLLTSEALEQLKKRFGDPSKWKRREAKKSRNSGHSYTSVSTKAQIPAKSLGQPCTCPRKCFDVVGTANCQTIFENYWKLGDHSAQTQYLHSRVLTKGVKKKCVPHDHSRRKATHVYSVLVNDKSIVVCLTAFLSIHSISEKRVRNACKKDKENGILATDMRGKHLKLKKTPDDVLQLIHEHIKGLSTAYTSRYSRAKNQNRTCLSLGSTQVSLYNDYLDFLLKNSLQDRKASFHRYKVVLKTYKLGFCDDTLGQNQSSGSGVDDDPLEILPFQGESSQQEDGPSCSTDNLMPHHSGSESNFSDVFSSGFGDQYKNFLKAGTSESSQYESELQEGKLSGFRNHGQTMKTENPEEHNLEMGEHIFIKEEPLDFENNLPHSSLGGSISTSINKNTAKREKRFSVTSNSATDAKRKGEKTFSIGECSLNVNNQKQEENIFIKEEPSAYETGLPENSFEDKFANENTDHQEKSFPVSSCSTTDAQFDGEEIFPIPECLMDETEQPEEVNDHPIDLFFKSIAATVKTFSPHYQNLCKNRVFNIVSKLEEEQISQGLK